MADASRSERLQLLSKAGLLVVAVFLLLTLLGGWIASTRPVAAIDNTKLENYQKSLHSYAAEGVFLAQQYKDQRPTSNYTKVSAQKLFEATSDVADELQAEEPEQNVEKQVDDTAKLANELADNLSKLAQLPDADEVNDIISQLKQAEHQFEKG
jgi:hypothetical protein